VRAPGGIQVREEAQMKRVTFVRSVGAMACAVAALAKAQTNFPESEPNDSKAQANLIAGIANGDTITGSTTGSTGTGASSAAAVYRYRLVLTTTGAAGHVGSIRGLDQTGGDIGTSDLAVMTSSASTSPARMVQWYGFGKQEEIYYRVAGSSSTTAPYTATFTRTAVTSDTVTGIVEGTITISTIDQVATDTDMWLYDANFNAIPGAGDDDYAGPPSVSQSRMTLNLQPGTYYLAISDYNLANNLASPPTDDYRDGEVLDFPDAVVCSGSQTNQNVAAQITSPSGTISVPGTKIGPYDIVWHKLIVAAAPTCHGDCPADFDDGSGTGVPDGGVTIDDLLYYLDLYAQGLVCADLDDGSGTGVPDGGVTIDDLLYFLDRYAGGC
jgi:hypothetical protein